MGFHDGSFYAVACSLDSSPNHRPTTGSTSRLTYVYLQAFLLLLFVCSLWPQNVDFADSHTQTPMSRNMFIADESMTDLPILELFMFTWLNRHSVWISFSLDWLHRLLLFTAYVAWVNSRLFSLWSSSFCLYTPRITYSGFSVFYKCGLPVCTHFSHFLSVHLPGEHLHSVKMAVLQLYLSIWLTNHSFDYGFTLLIW